VKKWLTVLVAVAISTCAFAADGWMTDFEKAKAKAKADNKYMLVDFSGSDWCSWCVKLDKEVFSKKVFQEYAKDNLVLLLVDWPKRTPDSKEVQAKSKPIMEKYGIQSFPTVLILSPDGKTLAKTGYQDGGPEAYVEHIKKLIAEAK
jgi:protein disulfide-isomerase